MHNEETRTSDNAVDDFLVAQAQMLMSHIDALLSAATQRIASYLVFAGLVFAALQIMRERHPAYDFLGYAAIASVGLYILRLTSLSIHKVTQYFMVINRIRGYFSQRSDWVKQLCSPLPCGDERPEEKTVFDPGIWVARIVLILSVFGLIYGIMDAIIK